MWILLAFGSAFFAGITAVFADRKINCSVWIVTIFFILAFFLKHSEFQIQYLDTLEKN